jgi:DNA modification methylase
MYYMELYHAECLEQMKKMEDASIQLVIVDLPYGQTGCKWDICIDLEEMWVQLKRICLPNTTFVFFTTTKFGVKLINSNPDWFRYDLVWSKTTNCGYLHAKRQPMRRHEMIYVFGTNKSGKEKYKKIYNPQKTNLDISYSRTYAPTVGKEGNLYGKKDEGIYTSTYTGRHPSSIQHFPNDKGLHPTQKPVELCKWLVRSFSNEGDKVLDFCMGSGSTGVACKETNRLFVGIEKDDAIYKIAENRLS